ncbi:hypothetical protein DFR50_13917 [Roseiarcus fermentans]|uniref:Uncharacterized protein n=1 Tax=Roseiarcus fermentans TaxID=1473586 RepID=A0A366ES77_9HYPH|nr:hypothetical protein [Roseiarcus fermentans]RBP04540.1 hypothetical protein DFR50_13917 [Roseiarcus fermentans]
MDQPAQNAHVSGNDNIVVQASGSVVTITTGLEPYLRLTQYEKRTKLAARNDSEAGLLSAYRADVVPLLGRDGARADLRAWLDAEAPVSIRVLVGAGGRGKTRLALELARAVAKDGWLAGFVPADELDRFRAQHGVEPWRWDRPVLVILDYSASEKGPTPMDPAALAAAAVATPPPARLRQGRRGARRRRGHLGLDQGPAEKPRRRGGGRRRRARPEGRRQRHGAAGAIDPMALQAQLIKALKADPEAANALEALLRAGGAALTAQTATVTGDANKVGQASGGSSVAIG